MLSRATPTQLIKPRLILIQPLVQLGHLIGVHYTNAEPRPTITTAVTTTIAARSTTTRAAQLVHREAIIAIDHAYTKPGPTARVTARVAATELLPTKSNLLEAPLHNLWQDEFHQSFIQQIVDRFLELVGLRFAS
ncbi:hypothetical protein M8J76_006693 [Diaphorina citri]|nr:hypothetical protein M8J76_006693 [Diaphorina citri]